MAECKNLYITDASVFVKWVFQNESDASVALSLKNHFSNGFISLAVPSFAFYEILNAVGLKDNDLAISFFSQLLTLKMDQYDLGFNLAFGAMNIIKKCPGVSFYDAVYHSLAINLGGTFLTADERYYQKTKSLKHIMMLKDYK